ncbi:MAG: ribbon-helix-helix domain-containing protein [Rhizobiaceae bacterium]
MSGVRKRSISLSGHRTSYSIEDEFQSALVEMALEQGISLAGLIASIDDARGATSNLSSALRIAALNHYQAKSA